MQVGMPQIARDRAPRKNLFTRLFEGVLEADRWRLAVSVDGYGVVCTSTNAPSWEPDPRAGSVDPIGAAILLAQPRVADVHRAALIALDCSAAMVAGLETGLRHEVPSREMMSAPNRDLFTHGLQVGIVFRQMLCDRSCTLHGRFSTQGPLCPVCVELEASTLTVVP